MKLRIRHPLRAAAPLLVAAAVTLVPDPADAQAPDSGTPAAPALSERWEVTGIPALNYDADEKFGYGAIVQLYRYGKAATPGPYQLTIQPTVFLTTGGRRDFTVFVDAPYVRGTPWRVDMFAGHETQKAYPYYGLGNATVYDEANESDPNGLYYRFARTRVQLTATVQRRLRPAVPLRVLLGAGAAHNDVNAMPGSSTTTLLAQQWDGREGFSNYVRAGLVWDTRDREVHTRRGTWADILVRRVDEALGSDFSYTQTTVTARQYVPVTNTITIAQRVVAQDVSGDAPFYDLALVQTSFKTQEGLGGAQTLRGMPKSRFIGKGMALSNTEVRWRAREFNVLGDRGSLTLSGFVDAGRVWEDGIELGSIASDLHAGYGVGARVGRGPNFAAAVDVGRSVEAAAAIYLGMGFLF